MNVDFFLNIWIEQCRYHLALNRSGQLCLDISDDWVFPLSFHPPLLVITGCTFFVLLRAFFLLVRSFTSWVGSSASLLSSCQMLSGSVFVEHYRVLKSFAALDRSCIDNLSGFLSGASTCCLYCSGSGCLDTIQQLLLSSRLSPTIQSIPTFYRDYSPSLITVPCLPSCLNSNQQNGLDEDKKNDYSVWNIIFVLKW